MSTLTDRKHFWYSKEQSKLQYKESDRSQLRVTYCILDNGEEVVYTVMSDTIFDESKFNDTVYLGTGRYFKTEYILKKDL